MIRLALILLLLQSGILRASSVSEGAVVLMVDKAGLNARLELVPEDPHPSRVLKTYKIAIGKESGDKQREGDNRTPEGIYISERIIKDRDLPEKYGRGAIPLNFPNPIDRLSGKTGHGIWLHGVEQDQRISEARVTEGCVAFYNQDIIELVRFLQPRHSFVVISNGAGSLDAQSRRIARNRDEVRQATLAWLRAWQDRDLDAYVSFYDRSFRYRGRKLDWFRKYKKRVFGRYRKMQVRMDERRILPHEKYVVVVMNQDFNGDNRYVSRGRKYLYWTMNGADQWRIRQEVFDKEPLEARTFEESILTSLEDRMPAKAAHSGSTGREGAADL